MTSKASGVIGCLPSLAPARVVNVSRRRDRRTVCKPFGLMACGRLIVRRMCNGHMHYCEEEDQDICSDCEPVHIGHPMPDVPAETPELPLGFVRIGFNKNFLDRRGSRTRRLKRSRGPSRRAFAHRGGPLRLPLFASRQPIMTPAHRSCAVRTCQDCTGRRTRSLARWKTQGRSSFQAASRHIMGLWKPSTASNG
jgi:hypothetical protein